MGSQHSLVTLRTGWLVSGLALLLAACNSGGGTTPAAPASVPESPVIPSLDPQITHEFAGTMKAGAGMIGMYELLVSAGESLEAELHPIRTAEVIGDTYDVDITTVLRSAPCGDCLQVDGIKLKDATTVAVTFRLAHPFKSTAARKDLHVFDVRGHLITGRGVTAFPGVNAEFPTGSQAVSTNPGLVLNADGYSNLFDSVVEGFLGLNVPGNTRPYKLFWKDFSTGNVNAANATGWSNVEQPRGHNVFPMAGSGSDNRATATYDLALVPGETSLSFLFMVDASYGQSAIRETRLTPKYFMPLFNQAAPVVLSTSITSGALLEGLASSSITLNVRVGDWQAGLEPPQLGFDPATAALNDIAYKSDLANLILHVPGVLSAPKTINPATKVGGSGKPSDPYRFDIVLQNEASAPAGNYWGIIRATDDATLAADGPTALNRDTYTINSSHHDYNTYQIFPVSVGVIPNLPPVAQIVPSRSTVPTGGTVEFCPGPLTQDPDGQIIKWEYDYDWDGNPANFSADAIRTPADASKCATTTFTNPGEDPVVVTVAMRVTDNGAPALMDIDSVEITIAPFTNEPPVADLAASNANPMTGVEITLFPGPGTSDPDGSIVQWEYDFDWDGNPANFTADVTKTDATPVPHTYANPGTTDLQVTAGLRVTDNGTPALTATDGLLITIKPTPPNQPPVAELLANPTTIFGGQTVTFWPGPGTTDPDGSIVLYEYDFDWDGNPANFTPDTSKTTTESVTHIYSNITTVDVVYRAGLRVTDNGTPGLTGLDDINITVRGLSPEPVWDFEDPADTLSNLGFSILGAANGLERGPIPPCASSKTYSNDPPSSYNAPPTGSTWGIVTNIGNFDYPGNTTFRALEESGSTAGDGQDNRYWSDAIYAIRTPVIPLNAHPGSTFLDLHHWFQTDLEYEVDGVAPGGTSPFTWAPMPNPGKVTHYDGGTVWVRPAPGGVPGPTATRLDVTGPQSSEPFWATFNNAIGYRWEMTSLFFMEPFVETNNWLQTNYQAGVDQGFSGVSYTNSVADRRPVVPDSNAVGGWKVNPQDSQWIDSRFDLSPWKGQSVVLEFRFASKKKDNPGCRTQPVGTTLYPPCIECMQNLEALTDTSINHRRSRGWRIDRIAVVEE